MISPQHRLALAKVAHRLRAARTDLPTFIETCVKDDHGKAISLAPLHRQWMAHVEYCWARDLRAIVLAPFGHGKCQPASAKIQMADGSQVPIAQLEGLWSRVLAFDADAMNGPDDHVFKPAKARAFANGVRKVLRICLNNSRCIEVTEEHPLFRRTALIGGFARVCSARWVMAKKLRVGDSLACAENHAEIRSAKSMRLTWGEVVSIDDVGEQPTFGLEVPGLETYVTGDVIVHNTSSFAVPLLAWILGRDPNKRIKVVTNDDASATKRVNFVKQVVESGTYKQVFPGITRGEKWTDHELYLKRLGHAVDPSIHARGIFTTGIGGRADICLFDDVVDQSNSLDAEMRLKVLNRLEQTWLTRLEPDGHVLYIGTLWHMDDATHHLMHRPGWCTLIQRWPDDCVRLEQELLGAVDDAYIWVDPLKTPETGR